ncbi:cyclic nucleotide-binding domain-containing protein [Clostridium sp. OS1-26]|uniref:cyclic nucleotide-binding domain-containing protein n=1 Tax=Clostridium sp. OS1-26 TaxID=3070681 RepID=UPI0027E03CA8|nr:cyclic nucleotide-binding domain-containing protein [Clostridium sp. OS1-26]WML32721.1 cyclic nucleotide-binding domain-containing protein [Clostridium sp. OS1-26]
MKKTFDRKIIMSFIRKYNLEKVLKENIIEQMELISFSKGEVVCSNDSELRYMFFLVEGKIKTYTLHDNGKSILLGFSYPLSVLGDVELFTDYNVICNVESIDKSTFIAIKMEKLRTYAYEDAIFLKFIIENLSSKLYSTTSATSINLLYSFETRLASYLLSMSNYNDNLSDYIEIKIPKLTEIAPLLGTSYRHLNRTVKSLLIRI